MKRTDFMSQAEKDAMGNKPRWHGNCLKATESVRGKGRGVARPGKTAHERALKERSKKEK